MARIVLLKLTTDKHGASRGLFATAVLLVLLANICSLGPMTNL